MLAEYRRRRDFMAEAVNAMPGCRCRRPEGAFYIFANIEGTGLDADTFCTRLLEETGVTVTPGPVFGDEGKGFVRISYANSLENLREAAKRMHRWLLDLER